MHILEYVHIYYKFFGEYLLKTIEYISGLIFQVTSRLNIWRTFWNQNSPLLCFTFLCEPECYKKNINLNFLQGSKQKSIIK